MMKSIASLSISCLALCLGVSGHDAEARSRKERELPPIADPGKVAATDIAFSRAAGDDGQWTAFRDFAAPDAVLHLNEGPVHAQEWLARQQDPAEPAQWGPKNIWSSCDGTVAVTSGRFRNPDGKVGSYATVWKVQKGNSYLWAYDLGWLDDPQPPPPDDLAEDTNAIIVSGMAMIEGKAADCRRDQGPPPLSPQVKGLSSWQHVGVSRDKTLQWAYEHQADGTRRVAVFYLRDGEWQEAVNVRIPGKED